MKISLKAIVVITFVVVTAYVIGHIPPRNLEQKAAELEQYCRSNGYNTDVGILVDYSLYSGRARFFVWDFRAKRVVTSSICAQGYGGARMFGGTSFSNVPESKCTSLGHYKIGLKRKMYIMPIAKAYELDGLDSSNSNARSRYILLHQTPLPVSIFPFPIPNGLSICGKRLLPAFSAGCITVPFSKFNSCSRAIDNPTKPVIMWVYN
ncbi:MAG: murein L,D-transpeptidase catalytic domain family protein [Alistipes sp.]|nr:murein L,D-transpeptidase catalytic domain family protein [Alistipes sp.]